MRWKQPPSDDTKQVHGSEKLAKADPKLGSKICSKNRGPHKGPPLYAPLPPNSRKLNTRHLGYIASDINANELITLGVHRTPEQFVEAAD